MGGAYYRRLSLADRLDRAEVTAGTGNYRKKRDGGGDQGVVLHLGLTAFRTQTMRIGSGLGITFD